MMIIGLQAQGLLLQVIVTPELVDVLLELRVGQQFEDELLQVASSYLAIGLLTDVAFAENVVEDEFGLTLVDRS